MHLFRVHVPCGTSQMTTIKSYVHTKKNKISFLALPSATGFSLGQFFCSGEFNWHQRTILLSNRHRNMLVPHIADSGLFFFFFFL